MDAKIRVTDSIEDAQAALERALAELDAIPTFNPAIVGFVAHALHSYTAATSATVELLQHALADNPNPEIKVWLDGIHHAADLTQHTIGRLLHASAPNDFPLRAGYVNLPVLMDRVCRYYRRIAEAQQVNIVCVAVGQVPLVWADRVAVAVVADNLMSNAVKVSSAGSTVYVHIKPQGDNVVCSVRDAGPGLSREQREQLLKRIAPAARPPATDQTGGYGLALAYEFIELMHGTLWCDSEPGHGATFSFLLPARE
jgi:signal transduction histidine kinase